LQPALIKIKAVKVLIFNALINALLMHPGLFRGRVGGKSPRTPQVQKHLPRSPK